MPPRPVSDAEQLDTGDHDEASECPASEGADGVEGKPAPLGEGVRHQAASPPAFTSFGLRVGITGMSEPVTMRPSASCWTMPI